MTAPESFDAFVAARGDMLLRHAYVLCGDRHLAEDLLQDALIKTHRHWRRVSQVDQPEAYVRRILLNGYLSGRRRRSASEVPTADHPPSGVDDHAAAHAERGAMWQLLAGLPRQQRAAVVLRFYEDLDDHVIGIALGCSASTARKHVSLALHKLRHQLEPDAPADRVKETWHG
jgi:RNA polymerase sigma-70 factor (sigma-E family)